MLCSLFVIHELFPPTPFCAPPVFPSCAHGSPSETALGLGRGAATFFQGPGLESVLLAIPAGPQRIESKGGIVVHIIVSKGNFVLVCTEVLVLKVKHRRSTKRISHLERALFFFFPVCKLKAITMEQTERKPSKEYCEWLWQVKAVGYVWNLHDKNPCTMLIVIHQ